MIENPPARPFSVVVGSGPAAMACAQALIDGGVKVLILDVGRELDGALSAQVEAMGRKKPHEWTSEEIENLKRPVAASTGGVVQKLLFGSDHVYGDPPGSDSGFDRIATKTQFSNARGGLSEVWGAAVLPYRDADLVGWPISRRDLDPHYRDVMNLMPVTKTEGNLEKYFSSYQAKSRSPLAIGAHAVSLLENYTKSRSDFNSAGFFLDRAQLAVDAEACVKCRLCIYGCPYHLIYSSSHTLDRFLKNQQVDYRSGIRVLSFSEGPTSARVFVEDLQTKKKFEIECDRVFIGAGAVASTRIALTSLQAYDRPIEMRDSQMFLAPIFFLKARAEAIREASVTLTQLFGELIDPSERERTIHFQFYAYSDVMKKAFEGLIPCFILDWPWFQKQFFGRMMIVQGFLDSEISGSVRLELSKPNSGETRLTAVGVPNPASRKSAKRALRKLFGILAKHGALPISLAMQFGEPGQSFHSGGTFPMRESPGEFETDTLGRPRGFKRVHLVDASVLPTIPSTTITLSVMANAHRIATAVAST